MEFSPARVIEPGEELALENEARIRLDLDGANVGLFTWDVVNHTSRWSTGFYRLHGLEPGADASYELWRSQVHSDDVERVEREIQRAVAESESVDVDYRIVQPGGELRWTSLQATIRRDAEGRALAMIGYCGDITRRKLAEAALLQSERLAIAGRMSAAIAHEINNPLEAAYNLLYIARNKASDDDMKETLDNALEQLRRVADISQQTLKFSRPSPPRSVDVATIAESTLHLVSPKLTLQNVQVATQFRGDCEVWCSPGELQQIFTNILNNAAEASRLPRKAVIRVRRSIDWKDSGRSGARITIVDAGPGMTPETLRRLREPFFTTKEETGTGLGMWVVTELVTKWNGRITIRSSTHPNHHGTAISLFLPTVSH